jgi:malonate-semialdehyde dehydrogenase (acetylating)/methylmalonate-semialdehyde dehydrogenase
MDKKTGESAAVSAVPLVPNVVGGSAQPGKAKRTLPLIQPATGETIGMVPMSTSDELSEMVQVAEAAQKNWGLTPLKDRVQVLFRLKTLLEDNTPALAEVINKENGKTLDEARASISRAIECVEYATSLPQLAAGPVLEVSRGVECKMLRFPLGVVAGITPFNFPLMVPLWMIPLAIGCGNAFILKPSEFTPLSALELAKLLKKAGLPDGLFSVIQGDKEVVEAICDHPKIKAVAFVGSTRVAKAVYTRATAAGKRVRALGGAKNHLIVVPDADPEMTATNIVASVTGCAGQRCMAASVLLAVGEVGHILDRVKNIMQNFVPGKDIGPVISKAAYDRITGYLERAGKSGAKLVLDGRTAKSQVAAKGLFLGPSIVDNVTPQHECAREEIFGPVLTVLHCKTLDEALTIENSSPYGNAACIYTGSGKVAQYFIEHSHAGMVGVNIGVPVPREPFAFGGWHDSRFGDGDITGASAIDFWSGVKKVTSKWSAEYKANWMS